MRGRLRSSVASAIGLATLLSVLSPIPAGAAEQLAPPEDQVRSVDPANKTYALPAETAPLTAEQILPVIDWSELQGIWPKDIVEVLPGTTDPSSPTDAVAGATALPREGAASLDAFGFGANKANHIALLYPQDLNREGADGKWVDIALTLSTTSKGWVFTDPAGTTIELPAELSVVTPLAITTKAGGVLTLAPATDAATAGIASGASVTYPGAFKGADLIYTLAPSGLQERIVLAEPNGVFTYPFALGARDLKLVPNGADGIDVLDTDANPVATLPAPVAYDASPEPAPSTGRWELVDAGAGTYALTATIDPGYLASATYPVVIDPAWNNWSNTPSRDGYTNQSSPSTSYESNDYLLVDSGKRIYLNFNTNPIEGQEVLVYNAELLLYPTASGGVTGGIGAKRVIDPLPSAGTLNWNNQPSIGTTAFDAPTSPTAGGGGWWSWNVTGLYQHYIDQSDAYNTHWGSYGVALTASNPKTFYAENAAGTTADPALYVSYNNLPNAPTLDTPANNYISEAESVTLKVNQLPGDPDGDDVMVSFQISNDGLSWTGTNLVFQSPYDDAKAFTVPSGVLQDGKTYYWRALSRDVCEPTTAAMCSLTDGLDTDRLPNASGVRTLGVELEHLGHDDRWAMWSRDVGSSMTLEVNQSNGNLYLDVPLASYATPIGAMNVSLAYNSLENVGFGMGAGWDVAIGPRSSAGGLPVKLYKLDPGFSGDIKIRFQGGRVLYFPYAYGRLWGGTSALSGTIVKNNDNTWTYTDADGGVFGFDTNAVGASGAELLSAKPAAPGAAASNKEFTYFYDANLRLDKVTDPLGRAVNLVWDAGGTLLRIRADSYGSPPRELAYTGGKLTSITTTVSDSLVPPTSHDEVLSFAYDSVSGRLNQVRDAVQTAVDGDGWDIGYGTGSFARVNAVTAPDSGSPATDPVIQSPWRFGYIAKSPPTQNVAFACLTDPRNTAAITCDEDFDATGPSTDDPYQTQTQLSDAGLPLKVAGAIAGSFRPISTYVFDNHTNLICSRTPEANALGTESCITGNLDAGGLSTLYDYLNRAPYRLLSVTHPAPASGAFPRLLETYAYDEGASFTGLWAEEHRNDNLNGSPNATELWTDLNQSWAGAGSPAALADQDGDHWGLRLSGYIDIADLGGNKKYKFRVFSDDGVRLSVEGKTILDCFGQAQDAGTSNCGTGVDVSTVLWGSDAPIQIEYSDITGQAQLTVKWNAGNPEGTFAVIPASRLFPDLGLVTSKTTEKLTSGGGSTDELRERWTYPDDDAKSRRLPSSHIAEDLSGASTHLYKQTYTYSATYGQVLTETSNAQDTGNDVLTSYSYQNGTAPTGWANVGDTVSCVKQVVADTVPVTDDITTTFQCDSAGRTTKQQLSVDAVSGTDEAGGDRTTAMTYDWLGRVVKTAQSETGAEQITIYDASGRPTKTRTLVSGATYTERGYVWDHAGHLGTEVIADPATGTVSFTTPWASVSHVYDLADNEIRTTNANGHTTAFAYDGLDRLTQQTSPSGLITSMTYQLGTGLNQVVTDTPSAASTTTTMDVLGRTTSTKLESYQATTTAYDVLSNVTSVTDPAGISASSTYSGLGELLTRTDFSQSGGTPATTNYTYDASGRLATVNGPLAGTQDTLTYAYDPFGRQTSTTYEGVFLENGSTKASASLTYNDAGEQIRLRQPLTTTLQVDRFFTYDAAGHQRQARTENGTDPDLLTTTDYNLAGWATKSDDNRTTDVFMGYDYLGRLVCRYTAACTSSTSGAERFAYDKVGNPTSAIASTSAPTATMDYDTDERIWKVYKAGVVETTYTYGTTGTDKGLLKTVLDPAGTTTFTYNAAGQLATADDPLVTTAGKLSTYTYNATSGRLTQRTDTQANLRTELAYEAATGRLDTEQIKDNTTSGVLASFDLGYDPAGNVETKTSSVFSNPSNTTWGYQYDGASRLTGATGENAAGAPTTFAYTYDGASNRSRATETTSSVLVSDWSSTYDARGLATSADEAVGSEHVDYAYDAAGVTLASANSSINANDRAYTYDAFSRLTCARTGTTTCGTSAAPNRVTYILDGFSRTWQRNENASITTYAFRGLGETVAKSTLGSVATKYAMTFGGSPLGQKIGTAAASYYLRDPHGDTVGIVSTAAANQGTTSFDPWGKVLGVSGTQPVFGFQSDLTDALTKQVDMGTRWYAPQTGRFSSRDVVFGDPLHPVSLNQWAYGGANPITMWDPTGMRFVCEGPCADGEAEYLAGVTSAAGNGGAAGVQDYVSTHPAPKAPEPVPPPEATGIYRLMTRGVTEDIRENAKKDFAFWYGGQGTEIVDLYEQSQEDAGWGDETWFQMLAHPFASFSEGRAKYQYGVEECIVLCVGYKHDPGLGTRLSIGCCSLGITSVAATSHTKPANYVDPGGWYLRGDVCVGPCHLSARQQLTGGPESVGRTPPPESSFGIGASGGLWWESDWGG